jgi:hypothetical protein
MSTEHGIKSLEGKLLLFTLYDPQGRHSDKLVFVTLDGHAYVMHHVQDCCESVRIDDFCGEIEHLQEAQVIRAEERSHSGARHDDPNSRGEREYGEDSQTWTFYELVTNKGSVTIRWYGESNGYYSESVSFERIDNSMGNAGALVAARFEMPDAFDKWAEKMNIDPLTYAVLPDSEGD